MKHVERVIRAPVEPTRVDLPGHLFVPADERESPCRITELSPDGASVQSELIPESGDPVVLYVDGLSRFEGMVSHSDGNVLNVKFVCSAAKRERTAEQIVEVLNKGIEGGSVLRRHERASRKPGIAFTRANGQIVPCEVIDISVSSVSLKTDIRPLIGEFVLIAGTAGRVARFHEHGIGVEFVSKES
jgi:hypothetical protein